MHDRSEDVDANCEVDSVTAIALVHGAGHSLSYSSHSNPHLASKPSHPLY